MEECLRHVAMTAQGGAQRSSGTRGALWFCGHSGTARRLALIELSDVRTLAPASRDNPSGSRNPQIAKEMIASMMCLPISALPARR